MKRLENKTAIVTGAGSGIGRAMAMRFAKEGSNVVIPDLNLDAAKETAKLVVAQGQQALPIEMDVTSPTMVESMVTKTIETYGHIDILVNNAGINLPAPFLEFPLDKWEKTLQVNLTGVFLCSQSVARQMVAQRTEGSIISIASIAAFNRYRAEEFSEIKLRSDSCTPEGRGGSTFFCPDAPGNTFDAILSTIAILYLHI